MLNSVRNRLPKFNPASVGLKSITQADLGRVATVPSPGTVYSQLREGEGSNDNPDPESRQKLINFQEKGQLPAFNAGRLTNPVNFDTMTMIPPSLLVPVAVDVTDFNGGDNVVLVGSNVLPIENRVVNKSTAQRCYRDYMDRAKDKLHPQILDLLAYKSVLENLDTLLGDIINKDYGSNWDAAKLAMSTGLLKFVNDFRKPPSQATRSEYDGQLSYLFNQTQREVFSILNILYKMAYSAKNQPGYVSYSMYSSEHLDIIGYTSIPVADLYKQEYRIIPEGGAVPESGSNIVPIYDIGHANFKDIEQLSNVIHQILNYKDTDYRKRVFLDIIRKNQIFNQTLFYDDSAITNNLSPQDSSFFNVLDCVKAFQEYDRELSVYVKTNAIQSDSDSFNEELAFQVEVVMDDRYGLLKASNNVDAKALEITSVDQYKAAILGLKAVVKRLIGGKKGEGESCGTNKNCPIGKIALFIAGIQRGLIQNMIEGEFVDKIISYVSDLTGNPVEIQNQAFNNIRTTALYAMRMVKTPSLRAKFKSLYCSNDINEINHIITGMMPRRREESSDSLSSNPPSSRQSSLGSFSEQGSGNDFGSGQFSSSPLNQTDQERKLYKQVLSPAPSQTQQPGNDSLGNSPDDGGASGQKRNLTQQPPVEPPVKPGVALMKYTQSEQLEPSSAFPNAARGETQGKTVNQSISNGEAPSVRPLVSANQFTEGLGKLKATPKQVSAVKSVASGAANGMLAKELERRRNAIGENDERRDADSEWIGGSGRRPRMTRKRNKAKRSKRKTAHNPRRRK